MLTRGDQNELLLAASSTRPVTTNLPLSLLLRTVPIYSPEDYAAKYAPTESTVKGWAYVRKDIYWCAKAFDKGAKGGQVWKVDIDTWREKGLNGEGWVVPIRKIEAKRLEESETESEESGSEVGPEGEQQSSGEESEGAKTQTTVKQPRKRKSTGAARIEKSKKVKIVARPRPAPQRKGKKLPHPKSSTSRLPISVPEADQLPVDPYQRALKLLHVGATPETLPCREEEFVDVLSKVEEGVESGGGGCLCEWSNAIALIAVGTDSGRYRWCPRYRKDCDGARRGQRAEKKGRGWGVYALFELRNLG